MPQTLNQSNSVCRNKRKVILLILCQKGTNGLVVLGRPCATELLMLDSTTLRELVCCQAATSELVFYVILLYYH